MIKLLIVQGAIATVRLKTQLNFNQPILLLLILVPVEKPLVRSAKVNHTTATLTAGVIAMDLEMNTVEATTENTLDTLSMPLLTREKDELEVVEFYLIMRLKKESLKKQE